MCNEKYNKIISCTLKGNSCNYIDSYVLVKDINDLENDLNVDLKGLCFNTDYKIEDIKNIYDINSLDELYDFCKIKEIWINPMNTTEIGLLVGAERAYLILKDLNPYGWICEDYIDNDEEKNKIIHNIKKEIEEKIEEETM